ncbi:MAG: hypothetical protein RLZZ165_433 [Bacteroidota bacterium]
MLWLLSGIGHRSLAASTAGDGLDSIPMRSLVLVEAFDAKGNTISTSVGVIVKKGFVALNFHYIVGASSVSCFRQGEALRHKSDGFLTVEESQDLIVISVPTLTGEIADLGGYQFPADGSTVQLTANAGQRRLSFSNGIVSGTKDILGRSLPQVISAQMDDCTGGPVFQGKKVVGFVVAGYRDDRYYAYCIPSSEARRLLNRSFIIKTYGSVSNLRPTPSTPFQTSLMESLEAVLWQTIPMAIRLAAQKRRMILIDVTTRWAGWSNLMDKNTYSKKSIIRYLNENFYAVRLDAETHDTITINGLTYYRNYGSPYHSLAYYLLDGNMQFPSTVILDEDTNELLAIPGYMDAKKLEVVLHYFYEKAYLNEALSFQQYEFRYWQRQQEKGGN